MTIDELLATAHRADIRLTIRAGRVSLSGPAGVLASDLAREIRTRAGEVHTALQARENMITYPPDIDCNTATPPPITRQVPEYTSHSQALQMGVAGPLHSGVTATVPADGRDKGVLQATDTATVVQHPTATVITCQVPEETAAENGGVLQCCSHFGGDGTSISIDSSHVPPPTPLEDRLVALLADGPMRWDWVVYRLGVPYEQSYGTLTRLLALRAVHVGKPDPRAGQLVTPREA